MCKSHCFSYERQLLPSVTFLLYVANIHMKDVRHEYYMTKGQNSNLNWIISADNKKLMENYSQYILSHDNFKTKNHLPLMKTNNLSIWISNFTPTKFSKLATRLSHALNNQNRTERESNAKGMPQPNRSNYVKYYTPVLI